MDILISMYICIYINTCTHTYIYMYMCVHIHIFIYVFEYLHVFMHEYINLHESTYILHKAKMKEYATSVSKEI